MKKATKVIWIFGGLVTFLLGGLILSKWIANTVTDRFECKCSSEHFNISYNLSDEKAVTDIQKYLEENYERITTNLKQPLDSPVEVKIYSDLTSFHEAVKVHSNFFWFTSKVPHWVVGTTNGSVIRIVSPLNPGDSGHDYDAILKVAVHEFTHVIASKINRIERSFVLSEGIATYEAGQRDLNSASPDILPSSIEEMFAWNESNEPHKMYTCGGSFVAFIVENYGYNKFIELYKRDYTRNVFDDDIREIYNQWINKIKN